MRVYFISSGLQGCYNVRCLQPLVANGWDGDQTTMSLDVRTPENKMAAAKAADVVVFHRPDDPRKLNLARALKEAGRKVVFDNDDTFKDDGGFRFNEYMDKARFESGMARVNTTLDAFVREADLVTASTKFLAEEYRQLNPNVVVLPNCVDPFYYDEPLRNENESVTRIGVTGSVGVTADLEVLKPIVDHYKDRPDVKIVFFSLPKNREDKIMRELYSEEYKWIDSIIDKVEWQPFVDQECYYDILNQLRLDMMIIPRADNYFNRCKSNLKFLEASMFEIPVIAQGFPDGQSPYEQDPQDAAHMAIVKDNKDWIPMIDMLAADRKLQRFMGKRAHDYVLEKYDIEKNAGRWVAAYESLFKANAI